MQEIASCASQLGASEGLDTQCCMCYKTGKVDQHDLHQLLVRSECAQSEVLSIECMT